MKKGSHLVLMALIVVVILAIGAVSAYAALSDDNTAPVTTSDAAAAYWNSAAIKLTAADASGVAYIYYRIDKLATHLYTVGANLPEKTITVAGPTTGTATRTFSFWAQDNAGNVEVHKSITLTIKSDKAAPTTAMSGAVDGSWYKATVPVALVAADEMGGSGTASVSFAWDGAQATVVSAASADAGLTVDAATTNGPHALTYHALDVAGNAETTKTLTVNVDTVKPTAVAPSSATATRGRTATLRYKVTDAAPNAGKATVVIQIKNSAGKVVKTLKVGVVSIGVVKTKSFAVPRTWRAGTYKFYVSATDAAGNAQAKIGSNKLVVK